MPPQGSLLFPTHRHLGRACGRMEVHPATRLHLQHRRPLTVLLGHLPPLSDACNNDFQNIVSENPVFLGFRTFLLDFFEIQRCFVDWRTKFYFSVVFSWKSGCFHCKILFFWYFLDFQELVRVRYASMTNTKPSRGVVCHYCHNQGHVCRIIGSCIIKIEDSVCLSS